jgi:hypothetical protein
MKTRQPSKEFEEFFDKETPMHHVSAVRPSLLYIDLRGGTVGRRRSCHCAKGREKRGSISRKRPPECRTLQVVPDFSSHRHWRRLTKKQIRRCNARRELCRMHWHSGIFLGRTPATEIATSESLTLNALNHGGSSKASPINFFASQGYET